MKSLFALLFTAALSYSAFAANNNKDAHKPSKSNELEKQVNQPEPAFLRLFVFDANRIAVRKDTTFRKTIKPDFDSLVLPDNKLWFKTRER
ncbi:MAG: hypothetical protein ACPF8V_03180 [Luteibaculum sp.]